MVGDDIKDDRLLLSAQFVSLLFFFFLTDDTSTFTETPAAGRGHHSGHLLENFLSRPRFKSGPVAPGASLCAKPPFTSLLW